MAIVISSENISEHNVGKYNFKVLSRDGLVNNVVEPEPLQVSTEDNKFTKDSNPGVRESDVDSSALSQTSKDSLIESLMKKTDDMSSNFIKLQMKLESKEEEYLKEIKKAKEEAFAEGLEAGVQQAKTAQDSDAKNGLEQFSKSVITLDKSAGEFTVALENIKNELVSAAIDIAQEVIRVELSDNSDAIATVLSQELIKELQSASKIRLKVNPQNHGAVSEKVASLENITVVSDSAVSKGGVIVISDAGNIDAQISKRFERVKRAALSE